MNKIAQVLFTRAPLPRKTKKRLTPFLTPQQAAYLHKAMILDTLSVMKKVRADILICHEPTVHADALFEGLGAKAEIFPQRGRALYRKVINSFIDVYRRGYQAAYVIVSDSPLIQPDHLQQAIDAVKNAHPVAVIGPSQDRGAYLLGMNHFKDLRFLEDIPWSKSAVLDILISRILRSDYDLVTLPSVKDIDEEKDVHWLLKETARAAPQELRHVKSFFRAHGKSIFNG